MHRPVMLEEAVAGLCVQESGHYVDGTYGRGGHAREILARLGPAGKLTVFDKDPDALRHAHQEIGADPRVSVTAGSFMGLGTLREMDGVLLDLGMSSALLADPARGFSFQVDGPLDMRYDPSVGMSAAEWLSQASEGEIADVLWRYGEERAARRIARVLAAQRPERTWQFAAAVGTVLGRRNKHPATKCFMALRLFINRELEELEQTLQRVPHVLRAGGRLVVIAFHSLESRMVKHFMREHMHLLHKARAGARELAENPRARSAILRVATS